MAAVNDEAFQPGPGSVRSGRSASSAISPTEGDGSSGTEDFFEYCDSSKSITNSVREYQKENGRTYHGYRAGTYAFPNDPTEADRQDFQYSVIQHALKDNLHYAPLEAPSNILDIGTGTGIWAIEMGELYPAAQVEATDLSPIQPSAVPSNVEFIIDDAEEEDWAVPENHYDMIHTRILMGCMRDFREVIRKGFKHTKPGGWMESADVTMLIYCDDGSMPDNWPFKDWSERMYEASLRADRSLQIADKLKGWFIEAGFVDVQEKVVKLPINSWPKNGELKVLGKWWAESLLMGMEAFSLGLFSRVLGWSKEEIEAYLVKVREAIMDRKVHAYHKFYMVYGRKPESPTATLPNQLEAPSPAPSSNSHHSQHRAIAT